LIYDIDTSMPIELVGDALLIEQALYTLLSPLLELSHAATVTVKFKKHTQDDTLSIQVLHSQNVHIEEESIEITQSILKKFNANLSHKGNTYTIKMPFLRSAIYNESYYSLPDTVIGQKVLLIEDNAYTAKTITRIFKSFKLDIDIKSTSQLNQITNFNHYDVLMVDSKLLTPILMRYLKEIKSNKDLHIISLETLYKKRDRRFKHNPLISKYLHKPLSTGIIFNLLYEIYVMHANVHALKEEKQNTEVFFIEERKNITQESFQDFNHAHVLIVEDNKINQKIIQSILEKSDIQISIANNGQEALEHLDAHDNINIVLMDINMPILDGYQTTKKIRENAALLSLPIVIVSTLNFRDEIEEMYLVGANAHLTKPFMIGQLYNAFDMFLVTANSRESLCETSPSKFTEDTDILDIQQGATLANNILSYRDGLRETLVMLNHSDEKIKENIIKKDYKELHTYIESLLLESKSIGAISLTQVLTEILILLHSYEEKLLENYIILYRDEWIKTKRNIELYLKSVNSY